jgi:PHD/YefM family antitoxin component YafN of YafNO toxin-antitoxin module
MNNVLSLINNIIPVTRFNRGEAAKIFEELKNSGPKVVIKNNSPVSVIMSPEEYARILEEHEDMELLIKAQSRLKDPENLRTYTLEEIMEMSGITDEDLDKTEEPEID